MDLLESLSYLDQLDDGIKCKRFMVFMYTTYYPYGGLEDLINSFDTLEEAIEFYKLDDVDYRSATYVQIFDRIEGLLVHTNKREYEEKWR